MGSAILPILFILPLLTYARIHIDVNMDRNNPENAIRISGFAREPVTEHDLQEFDLNMNKLKDGIQMHFGQRPDEVYVRSPTPYGDMYTIFGWKQVMKMLRPIRAEIISISATPEVLLTKIYKNREEINSEMEIPVSHKVQNVIMSNWVVNKNMSIDDYLMYSFNIESTSMGDRNMMNNMREFGKNMMVMDTVNIGSNNIMISLSPKQSIVAELYANKEIVSVQVDYETKLVGTVAMSYDNGFRGHKFWSADINAILDSMKMDTAPMQASEMLQFTYYTELRMVLRDFYSNEVLFSIPMKI